MEQFGYSGKTSEQLFRGDLGWSGLEEPFFEGGVGSELALKQLPGMAWVKAHGLQNNF